MYAWESSLIDEYTTHPAPIVPRPRERATENHYNNTKRCDYNDPTQRSSLPAPPNVLSGSETRTLEHSLFERHKSQNSTRRQYGKRSLKSDPVFLDEGKEASRARQQRQMHRRQRLATLPEHGCPSAEGILRRPLQPTQRHNAPLRKSVDNTYNHHQLSSTRKESSPRRLLWPTENDGRNQPRNTVARGARSIEQSTQHSDKAARPKYRSPRKPDMVRANDASGSRCLSSSYRSPSQKERRKLSLAEQRYQPRDRAQSDFIQKCLKTALSNTKARGAGSEPDRENDVPSEIKRPGLFETMVEKLPQSPPTVHVHDSHALPSPGSPKNSSTSRISPGAEKDDPFTSSYPLTGDMQVGNLESKAAMRKLLRWEIWLYRILFGTVLVALNISLLIIYFFTPRHHYLLALLVFMKSKDILSTAAGIPAAIWYSFRDAVWTPEEADSKWIMSLVCAYAETEAQIMKTVNSLVKQDLVQHKQVMCIILDGRPRDILSHFTRATHLLKRSYTTWKGVCGEIQLHAGFINDTPVILIQKSKNAGKKDTLILGHTLFNYPRDDAPIDVKVLRREIFTHILPTLTGVENFKSFDNVYATDADSTIHHNCLKELADAIARNPKTIAACGIIIAELENAEEWSAWHLFQQFQYTFGQYVRRQAESVWGRVTCLPGPVTMVKVRPEMGRAISDYAAPVTNANLFQHQVQYQGTDRRLTWCMLSQGRHLRTVLVTKAIGETIVPTTLDHYLSQRRRWAGNAYFNDYMYAFGKHQHPVTRLFGMIDIVRMSFVYYRVMNTALFIRSLARNFYLIKIIPTLILTKSPTTWFLLLIIAKEPVLRKRFHKLLCGILLNQVMSPVLSVIVFSRVLLNMGNHAWGKTGVSTHTGRAVSTAFANPPTPKSPWSPRRLMGIITNAIGTSPSRDNTKVFSETNQERNASSSDPSTRTPTIGSRTSSVDIASEDIDAVPPPSLPQTPSSKTINSRPTLSDKATAVDEAPNIESTVRKRKRSATVSIAL